MTIKEYKLFGVWKQMKSRCYNVNNHAYERYGGRGIIVCEKWKKWRGFKEDMFSSYQEGLSLDRIDNNGNYELNNCRWATRLEQANNTRRVHLFEHNGIKKTLINWAKKLGIKRSTLAQRIYVYRWSIDRALTRKGGY